MSNAQKPLKKMPIFKTDEEAEHFVDTADLSEYDFSDMVTVQFNFVEPLKYTHSPSLTQDNTPVLNAIHK
jgi:hypothetical protein